MNKNTLLFIENLAVWSGVVLAYAVAILPLIQLLAGLAAFIFSILSIIKILNNWSKNDSKN